MDELQDSSRRFKRAFDAYVSTIRESPEDAKLVTRAMNELHAAVRLFTETSIEISGWANPFILPKVEDEERKPQKTADTVQVDAQYKLQITNTHTFRQLVLERARKSGNFAHAELDTPVGLIHELFAIDGWDPHHYGRPDLKVLLSRWSVSPDWS